MPEIIAFILYFPWETPSKFAFTLYAFPPSPRLVVFLFLRPMPEGEILDSFGKKQFSQRPERKLQFSLSCYVVTIFYTILHIVYDR